VEAILNHLRGEVGEGGRIAESTSEELQQDSKSQEAGG
jgi:hypothetical protein